MKARPNPDDRLARRLFIVSTYCLALLAGVLVQPRALFLWRDARTLIQERLGISWYYVPRRVSEGSFRPMPNQPRALNLVVGFGPNRTLFARVEDMERHVLHAWDVDIFRVWPEPLHIERKRWPKGRPGGLVDGAQVAPNGDLIFNYEEIGLVRMDMSSRVIWRLPYRTHHSIHANDDGTFWVPGEREHQTRDPRFPNYAPPFFEFTVLRVSGDGIILKEISVSELLLKNGYQGLLSMGKAADMDAERSGDMLHLNDVQEFPGDRLAPGVFAAHDVVVSLREINAIVVFNAETLAIRYMSIGRVTRQHDPEFVDGNTISIYDNNACGRPVDGCFSKIVLLDARSGAVRTYYDGRPGHSFYTPIMGKHQWLANGNLLITAATEGKAFEVSPSGEVVWEYINYVDDGHLGVLSEVQRLPMAMQALFQAGTNAKDLVVKD